MKKEEKEEKLTLCHRYICKMCPRNKKCEEELSEVKKRNIKLIIRSAYIGHQRD